VGKLSKIVTAAMNLLLSGKSSINLGGRTITRADARKLVNKESARIEAGIRSKLTKT